jgi:hypothetical protein
VLVVGFRNRVVKKIRVAESQHPTTRIQISMPSPKAEKEWLEGPSRRVIVHARKIPNERKRLLALCGFFNKYRQLFSHAAIPLAMDIVEKFADGVVGEPHYKRAAGLIQTFDWGRESID